MSAFVSLGIASDIPQRKVDDNFAPFNKPGSPGCAIGVIRNGDFVLKKAYGLASLELGVPLSPESVFYLGSVAKQFTAAAVVLAAEQGFLSLDDSVRKYVPELPDYGHEITLRHLLHQTSGLRDFLTLIYLSGQDPSAFNSPDQILKLIVRQKGLNNTPGDEFIYSNTNYFLLGLIVQRATKKSLAAFAFENIFQPLGMSHTLFYDNPSVVVPGRVAAYDAGPHGDFLVDWSTTYAVVGGGGLLSSVDDLALWDRNFYANSVGKGTLTKELLNRGVLNSGKKISYAMGLRLGRYRALPIEEHNGSLFGYRADLLRFPRQRLTVVCLCNVSSADPGTLSRKIADLYLADSAELEASPLNTPSEGTFPGPETFAGTYLDRRSQAVYSFRNSDNKLMAWGSVLRRIAANQFYDLEGNVITFTTSDGTMSARLDVDDEVYFSGTRVPQPRLSGRALSTYAGQFASVSDELDAAYNIFLNHNTLLLRVRDNKPKPLVPITRDVFTVDGVGTLVFDRDNRRRVRGVKLFTTAVRGIPLSKR